MSGIIQRLAAPVATLPAGPSKWTSAATDMAINLWAKAPSATNVAEAVNRQFGTAFSRKAVIAKMHWSGLSHQGPSLPPMLPKGTKGVAKAKRAPAAVKPKPALKAVPTPVARLVPRPTALPLSRRVSITEIGAGSCRFIAGDPRVDSPCCGHPAELASAWCPTHARLCTTASKPRVSSGFQSFRRAA